MASERLQRQIDLFLDEAAEAAEAKDWAAVANAARRALVADSDNAEARTFLRIAEVAREQPEAEATAALDVPPGSAAGDAGVRVGARFARGTQDRPYARSDHA